jgi:UDP:flavonoid glycosyltransferase YjiC (YdhE family)
MNNAQRATRNARPTIGLAVSGHGFGHSVRCAEVARVLLERGARVVVRTDAPAWLFPDKVEYIPSPGWALDVGVAQHDGLDLDVDETRRRWTNFARDFQTHAEAEGHLLRQYNVDVVLGDVPPLAFAAAAQAHIPSLALANFGWDWIYAAWLNFETAIECVRAGYRQADVLLRLPLHSDDEDAFAAFKCIVDVPLIGRAAQRSRSEVRADLNLPRSAKLVLFSFGGFTAQGLNLEALGNWSNYLFVVTPPLSKSAGDLPPNVVKLNETPEDYVSLVSACDVVVTKPGYGIAADCLANHVAVLFSDRGPFREYDVLADALPALGRARFIPRDELLRGHLGPHLDLLLESDTAWTTQPMTGAAVVAERLLERLTTRRR